MRRAFRPALTDRLEDRSVPAGGSLSLPARDALQVAQAVRDFQRTYAQDVQTILLKNGTTPSANRAAFDAAIGRELSALDTKIDGIIANLPTASTLDGTIGARLLTATPAASPDNSLQGLLGAITTPSDTSFRSLRAFTRQGARWIDQVGDQVVRLVRTAPAPAGTIDAATLRGDVQAANAAFRTFSKAYNDAVKDVLLPAGATDPSANRAAFDAAVATALQGLNTGLASAVANLPTGVTGTLNTTLRDDVLRGATPDNSLQTRLASIATPTSTRFFGTASFRFQSLLAIGRANAKVVQDITAAVASYNASL
ncbi:MAG: hypothetical protein U0800_00555 [Isosphaeraceae bacterium]